MSKKKDSKNNVKKTPKKKIFPNCVELFFWSKKQPLSFCVVVVVVAFIIYAQNDEDTAEEGLALSSAFVVFFFFPLFLSSRR